MTGNNPNAIALTIDGLKQTGAKSFAKIEMERKTMSLTIEVSPELETRLREAAARQNRDVSAFILDAATEKADWVEADEFSPAQEAELARRLEAYRRDGDTGRSWAEVRAELTGQTL